MTFKTRLEMFGLCGCCDFLLYLVLCLHFPFQSVPTLCDNNNHTVLVPCVTLTKLLIYRSGRRDMTEQQLMLRCLKPTWLGRDKQRRRCGWSLYNHTAFPHKWGFALRAEEGEQGYRTVKATCDYMCLHMCGEVVFSHQFTPRRQIIICQMLICSSGIGIGSL